MKLASNLLSAEYEFSSFEAWLQYKRDKCLVNQSVADFFNMYDGCFFE